MREENHAVNAERPSIPTASFWDNLCYNIFHFLPYYTRGPITRKRFWVALWARIHPDPMGVRFFSGLRRKYKSNYFFLYQMVTKSLVVLDPDGIQHVLDHSPDIYAEPRLKRKVMSHFQPGALTISRGEEWQERRRFNAAVLLGEQRSNAPTRNHKRPATKQSHPYAEHFLSIIQHEVQDMLAVKDTVQVSLLAPDQLPLLRWQDFVDLFQRITLQIIFGEGNRDTSLAQGLTRMMQESNRVFALRPSKWFDGFHTQVNDYLTHPTPNSLTALCRQALSTSTTRSSEQERLEDHSSSEQERRPDENDEEEQIAEHMRKLRVSSQIAHWLFAMKDTLAENVVMTLALIAAFTEVELNVREEMTLVTSNEHPVRTAKRSRFSLQPVTPKDIQSLDYLEACIQEAMRLWPTTPQITRETVVEDTLGSVVVPPGTQVLIFNNFNHRDQATQTKADCFYPERWLEPDAELRFNHFSRGPQGCVGQDLALFIAKAVLVSLLSHDHYELLRPTFHEIASLPHAFNHFGVKFARVKMFQS